MNKTAFDIINESFEKIASRAWKRKLGELGEKSVDKLLDSGVFNRTKELKGLNLGTNRILQKSNAKNFKNGNKATAHMMESVKRKMPTIDTSGVDYKMTKSTVQGMGLFGSPDVSHAKWNKSGLTNVPGKAAYKKTNELVNNIKSQYEMYGIKSSGPSKLKRNDREGKKWANAILARHEADEVRYGGKVLKNKKLTADLGNGKQHITGIGSHMTPKVLISEASNVALAPKSTQNYFKKMRGMGMSGGTEVDALRQHTGFDYNKASGVYDKAKGRKGEKNIANFVRNTYGI